MSALSTSTSSSLTAETDSSSSDDDRFRRSAPRLSKDVANALRESVVQMVAHQAATAETAGPNSTTTLNATLASQRKRAPQCTHIAMTRLYGRHACMICGQEPELGFVYKCQQDHLQQIREKSQSVEALPLVPDHGDFFEAQAEIARSLGMNHSIVTQMRAGEYSYEQIETLLNQRREVKEVIKEARRSPSKKLPKSDKSLMSKLIASSRSDTIDASKNLEAEPSTRQPAHMTSQASPITTFIDTLIERPSNMAKMKPMCNFQVCHPCRPYFKDRVPTSFEAVFNDEISAGTGEEIFRLPIRNAFHLRNVGMRQGASATKLEPRKTVQTELENEIEELSDDSTPTSSSSDVSFHPDQIDPYPCPGILICPLYSPSAGCAYEQGFDDGNRAINHGFVAEHTEHAASVPTTTPGGFNHARSGLANSLGASPSNASSISLPDPETEPLTPSKPHLGSQLAFVQLKGKHSPQARASGRSASQPGYAFPPFHLRGRNSDSSLGSEIEVDGGVALTEQAVETGVPDILTDGLE